MGLVAVENGGDGDNVPPAKRPAATLNTTDTPRLWPYKITKHFGRLNETQSLAVEFLCHQAAR